MDAERGGRPLSLDSDGFGSMYFLPGKIAVFDKEPPTDSHRYLLTNFAFSPSRILASHRTTRRPIEWL